MTMWRPVLGFEGLYEVSDNGDVRSLRRSLIMSPNDVGRGYLAVGLSRNGVSVTRHIHRIVLEAFVGPRPDGCVASHLNGDPSDNRAENLVWESQAENCRRKEEHGTYLLGNDCTKAKLTDDEVIEIRRMIGTVSNLVIADRFGVSPKTIRDIKDRKTWWYVA